MFAKKEKSSGSSLMNGLEWPVCAMPLLKKSSRSSKLVSGLGSGSFFSFSVTGREYCKSKGFSSKQNFGQHIILRNADGGNSSRWTCQEWQLTDISKHSW